MAPSNTPARGKRSAAKSSTSRSVSRSLSCTTSRCSAVKPSSQRSIPFRPRNDKPRSGHQRDTTRSRAQSTAQSSAAASRNFGDLDSEFSDDTLNEIVMAVDVRSRGTVGCAYYVARDETLYLMQDTSFGGPDTVEHCEFPASQSNVCADLEQ